MEDSTEIYSQPKVASGDGKVTAIVYAKSVYWQVMSLLQNSAYGKHLSYLLLLFDIFLSIVIIDRIPYTEIDWETYMQQIAVYRKGERNYENIGGDTGPLVYPAGHVHIFNWLFQLTDGGKNRRATQAIFLGVYILTLWVVLGCYRMAKVPPWVLPLVVLSKRLHSIYLLRFFNDCFCTLFAYTSIWLMMRHKTLSAAVMYSLSVSVKMSSLLYLPAVGLVSRFVSGRNGVVIVAAIIFQVQIALASPFIFSQNGSVRAYISRAFEFNRQFLWEWTVNWRFVGEEIFLSASFHRLLLGLHLSMLLGFAITVWRRVTDRSIKEFILYFLIPASDSEEEKISNRCSPDFILTTLLSCNLIGVLFARSLHYQFYSWMVWGTPFLLWKSGLNLVFVYAIWLLQEWAWNVFPSTEISSAFAIASMLIQLIGVWFEERRRLKSEKIKLKSR